MGKDLRRLHEEDMVARRIEYDLSQLADTVTIERLNEYDFNLVIKHDNYVIINRRFGVEGLSIPYVKAVEKAIEQMKLFIKGDKVDVDLFKGERVFVEEVLRFMEGIPLTFSVQANLKNKEEKHVSTSQ